MQPDPALKLPEKTLSPRMVEVITHLSEGKTLPQIASLMGISIYTARTYAARSYERLGASNRTEAVVSAIRLGIVSV